MKKVRPPKRSSWKLERMCDNCPFSEEGPGLQLRLSLARGRWKAILGGLLEGQHFLCHKTTASDGDDDELADFPKAKICAGSRYWQAARGIVSDAEQIMTRLELINSERRKR